MRRSVTFGKKVIYSLNSIYTAWISGLTWSTFKQDFVRYEDEKYASLNHGPADLQSAALPLSYASSQTGEHFKYIKIP